MSKNSHSYIWTMVTDLWLFLIVKSFVPFSYTHIQPTLHVRWTIKYRFKIVFIVWKVFFEKTCKYVHNNISKWRKRAHKRCISVRYSRRVQWFVWYLFNCTPFLVFENCVNVLRTDRDRQLIFIYIFKDLEIVCLFTRCFQICKTDVMIRRRQVGTSTLRNTQITRATYEWRYTVSRHLTNVLFR